MIIKDIIIVGGGTAGWMTAAAIQKELPDINLTLIESSELPTVGVGESTLPDLEVFLDMMNIDKTEALKMSRGTLKGGILFKDFHTKGSSFLYPFGVNPSQENTGLIRGFEDLKRNGVLSSEEFTDIFFDLSVAVKNNNIINQNKHDYFLQLDVTLFARYLRTKFCNNINHYVSTIEEVVSREGSIEKVITADGQTFSADLFVDASGFNSLLMKHTKSKYDNFDEILTDSAIVVGTPYKDENHKRKSLLAYTECVGMDAGWKWRIPLWDKMSNGYVYSSKHIDKNEAEKEFRKSIDWDGEVRHISFKNGMYEQTWISNTIGIGLSANFIEPLESTGLAHVTLGIEKFIKIMKMKKNNINNFDKSIYNTYIKDTVLANRKFVALHYITTTREDTNFWRHYQHLDLNNYDNNLYHNYGTSLLSYNNEYHQLRGAEVVILEGCDYNLFDESDIDLTKHKHEVMRRLERNIDISSRSENHYDYLKKNIYQEK